MAQIDWELIRKRMLIYKYQPGYFTGGAVDPCANWILFNGVWSDSGVWQDTCLWDDGSYVTTTTTTIPPTTTTTTLPPFSPSDISDLTYWHDYTDTSMLDLDTNSPTSVYRVKDKATLQYDFMQPVKAAQPITGNDGKNYVIPTGVTGSGLYGTISGMDGFYTICSVFRFDTDGSYPFFFEHSDGDGGFYYPTGQPATRFLQHRFGNSNTIQTIIRNPFAQVLSQTANNLTDGNLHLLVYRNNDTQKNLFLDGTLGASASLGSTETANVTQMAGVVSTYGVKYRVYEQMRYNKALSDAELAQIYQYYQTKYS